MREVKLGDVVKILDSRRVPLNSSERNEIRGSGKYPYIGANNIVDWIDEYLFDEEILCIAEDGGSWGKFETCTHIYREKCWVNNHAHVLSPSDQILITYLSYYLDYQDLNAFITGTTRGKLNQTKLKQIPIPLPSLEEQKAIVAKLDRAQRLIDIDKAMLAKYDQLIQSVFMEMFGDPVTNPKGWEVKKLNELVTKLGDGLHGTPNYSEEGDYFFVNGNNLNKGKIIIDDRTKKVSEEEFNKYKKEMNKSTVLVSINGTIGKIAFYNNESIMLGKSACYFNLEEGAINKVYLYHLIDSPYFLNYAGNQATGSTIKNVSLKSMRNFPVPLPPKGLQKEFEKSINTIAEEKNKTSISLRKSEDLFSSLVQEVFG